MTHFEQLETHLLDDVLVFANLIQIPAVILTGGAAWLVCRPIRRWASRWVERVPEHHHLDWVVSHRSWVTDRLVPLITPMAWAIGLWISVTVAERAGWPHAITQTAVSLLLAWLVIRLAAALNKLSPRQRAVFTLRHFEDMSLEEIGGLLGLDIGTVKAHMFRAVAKLRVELREFYGRAK